MAHTVEKIVVTLQSAEKNNQGSSESMMQKIVDYSSNYGNNNAANTPNYQYAAMSANYEKLLFLIANGLDKKTLLPKSGKKTYGFYMDVNNNGNLKDSKRKVNALIHVIHVILYREDTPRLKSQVPFFSSNSSEEQQLKSAKELGFKVINHKLELYGYCSNCS